jgi:hypothetical protein
MGTVVETERAGQKYFQIEDEEGLTGLGLLLLMQRLHAELGDDGLRKMPLSLCLSEVETHRSRIVCVNNECDMSTLWFKVSDEFAEELDEGLFNGP